LITECFGMDEDGHVVS